MVAEPALPEREPTIVLGLERLVKTPVVANKLVEVEFVEVLFEAIKFWRVDRPFTNRVPVVVNPELFRIEEKRFELKKFVEVAFVVVEFRPVKFWRVVEPLWRTLVKFVRPPKKATPRFGSK